MNLFIIGNGFDIAHNIPSSYNDFHNYLRKKYDADDESALSPIYTNIGHHGEEIIDEQETANQIATLITQVTFDNWNGFENSLDYLDFSDYFEPYRFDFRDSFNDKSDKIARNNYYNRQDIAEGLRDCLPIIKKFFTDWINEIDCSIVTEQSLFRKIINPTDDTFLSFNYTLLLENIYKCNSVCHIHGSTNENILVGHGNRNDLYPFYEKEHFGSQDAIEALHDELRKPTECALKENYLFFKSLSNVNTIYSIGFSFSPIDMIYVQEIVNRAKSSSVTWMIDDYPCKIEQDRIKKELINLGVKQGNITFRELI